MLTRLLVATVIVAVPLTRVCAAEDSLAAQTRWSTRTSSSKPTSRSSRC